MPTLKLGLLGSLQVTVAKAPISTFESDKARALLAYLAVESDRPHRRDSLLGLLWPDCPQEIARRNLRQSLYSLRQAIGDPTANPPYLLISREEIQFNTASDHTLDVAAFHSHLAASAAHPHSQIETCALCAGHLRQAVELYRGKFLQEFFLKDSAEFEEWALVRREALHRQALEALEQLANYHEQHGEYEAARGYGLRQLELDPWREEAHRQVMRALAMSGQRSAALAQYETCRRVLAKELGVEPSAETRELHEQISRDQLGARRGAARPARMGTLPPLPTQPTPFVGREHELAGVGHLIADPNCRLLTLVGPGGIGKTRLALQAASAQRGLFAHGAAFISLAPVTAPALIVSVIAEATGLVFDGAADPRLQLVNFLRDKQALLVLDNLEHLLVEGSFQEDGTRLFVQILNRAPGVKLLVTSREPLNLREEWIFQVEGLQVPENDKAEAFEQSSAVALFLQRARRAHVGFDLRPADQAAIVRICRLVGGMPLAIELAAAWVRTLSCPEIAHEIEHDLDILTTSMRDLPERHRSVRAVFDQSWHLLSEQERAVLRELSVFRGGLAREAAQIVTGANLPLLSLLMARSLLRRMPGGRYDLHELVRQYAADHLQENPEEESDVRDRHSAYYMDFIQSQEKLLKSARQPEALERISAEIENLRIAWHRAVTRGQIASIHKPLKALWLYFEMRGRFQEARALMGWAVEQLEAIYGAQPQPAEEYEVLQAFLRAQQGWFCVKLGELDQARRLLEPATAKLRALGAGAELADAIHFLWGLEWVSGRHSRARALSLEKLALAGQGDDPWEIASAYGVSGRMAYLLGEYQEALENLETSNAMFRDLGDPGMMALSLCYLGAVQVELGMNAAAQASLHESAARSRVLGDRWNLGESLCYLGVLAQAQESYQEALDLLREALGLFKEIGDSLNTIETLNKLGTALQAMGADAQAHQAFCEGLALAMGAQILPGALEAAIGIAGWQLKKGEPQSALELLEHVRHHPSSHTILRKRAEDLRVQVEHKLTPKQVKAAGIRARARSFDELVEELLNA